MGKCSCNIILPTLQRAPARYLIEEVGSVITCGLTRRAADGWVRGAFFEPFSGFGLFSRFDSESQPTHRPPLTPTVRQPVAKMMLSL
jgi:hypothetical protein